MRLRPQRFAPLQKVSAHPCGLGTYHSHSPPLITALPLGEAGSCKSKMSTVLMCPNALDATMSTSGVPAQARLASRVGSVPKPRVIMQAVFPWRQGTAYADVIASVKFSQPERLHK